MTWEAAGLRVGTSSPVSLQERGGSTKAPPWNTAQPAVVTMETVAAGKCPWLMGKADRVGGSWTAAWQV